MISPQDIKTQCEKLWREVIRSGMESSSYFPYTLTRVGQIKAKDILLHLQDYQREISQLDKYADFWGYEVIKETRQFEKIGFQLVPVAIRIPSLDVYLKIVRKKGEWETCMQNFELIRNTLPALEDWCREGKNCLHLIAHDTWNDTLKVCMYFLQHPCPGKYLRELPVEVHTKYIEQNESLLKSLLDFLLPPEAIHTEEKSFELRYGLKYAEPLIRLRFLDESLSPCAGLTDISVQLSDFRRMEIACRYVILAENKMNFLTLPPVPQSLAIWSGGGFNISFLKNIPWLADKQWLYWGDLDAQGMQILHQCRSYYPSTRSFLMDRATFERYRQWVVAGKPAVKMNLSQLTPEEKQLYDELQEQNLRLEQEKILQEDVVRLLPEIVGKREDER